jgi:hypothetical protein
LRVPGLPNAAVFAVLASALTLVPSQATASSPQICDHRSGTGDSGQDSRRNSSSNGLAPTRRRAAVSAVVAGTCHPAAASARPRPLARSRITCP